LIGNGQGHSHFEAVCASASGAELLAVGYTQSSDFVASFAFKNPLETPPSHTSLPLAVRFGGTQMKALAIETGFNSGATVESNFNN